ncbi:MAG: transposase [archaeon]|nr:transposase [archaeon]
MNYEKALQTYKILDKFIYDSLGLKHRNQCLDVSQINKCLVDSSAYNTYIETHCNKSDTIYRYIKESEKSMFTFSYLDFIKQVSKKINLDRKKIVLAFDYTHETFWGDVQGFDIHGTPKNVKGTGEFKFLTMSQVSGKVNAHIPLVSIPVQIGHNKTSAIVHCLELIKDFVGEIELILFDRGFYDFELIMTLNKLKYPYLMFVPKQKGEIQNTLNKMFVGETLTKVFKFDKNINKTVYHDETTLAFLKDIFDGKPYTHFDWCFVTNLQNFDINKMIPTYKCRWRIETGFRIQDDANCKTKSKEMTIRYFIFLYEQLLQSIWHLFYSKQYSFKQFIINIHNHLEEKIQLEGSKVHTLNKKK